LVLTEKELDEEITRILNANNPHAAQNYSRYNHKEQIFKTVANMEHHTMHFEFDGYLIYKGDEAVAALPEGKMDMEQIRGSVVALPTGYVPAEEGAGDDLKPKKPHRNQFNFSERAAQTANNPYRVIFSKDL
jgi:dynein intermediate chain 1